MPDTNQSLPEILAPVGDWDMLRAAVHNGADAVYMGMPGFNARGRAPTLELAELRAMIEYAHLYGVRVLLAFNILIFERELQDAIRALNEVIPLAPDAFIVQDIGLVRLIRALAPNQAVHASTQMTITNSEAIDLTSDLGMRRYVLGREVSIAEMHKIREKTDKELEVFTHGALCVSYSGQCLTSESFGGRSANRGQCAQSCRLSYDLIVDGKKIERKADGYLVSPQDLCGLEDVPRLIEAGINSFKIEGRLKSPAYVASAARAYKQRSIGNLSEAETKEAIDSMARVYSRGFFNGWLDGVNHQRLVNPSVSSHHGLPLGVVSEVRGVNIALESSEPIILKRAVKEDENGADAQKHAGFLNFSERNPGTVRVSTENSKAKVILSRCAVFRPATALFRIIAGDGLVFRDPETGKEFGGVVFNSKREGRKIVLSFSRDSDLSKNTKPGFEVYLNSSPRTEKELERSFADKGSFKKIPISVTVRGAIGEPLELEVTDRDGNLVTVSSNANLETAQKAPLTEESLAAELGALGGTVFVLERLQMKISGTCFIHSRELKELRRAVTDRLAKARISREPQVLARIEPQQLIKNSDKEPKLHASPKLNLLVREFSQLSLLAGLPIDTVYLDFEFGKEYGPAVELVRSYGYRAGIATTRILKPGELAHLKVIERLKPESVLVRNLGALEYLRRNSEMQLVGDFSLNITNSLSADWFLSKGLKRLCPSYDLNGEQLVELLKASDPGCFEVTLHHYIPAFHMEHCVFAAFLSNGSSYRDCGRPCEKHRVELRDNKGALHPLKADAECRNTMFNGVPQTALKLIPSLTDLGVATFRVEVLFDSAEVTRRKVEIYAELLAGKTGSAEVVRELGAVERYGVTDGQLYAIRGYTDRKKDFVPLDKLANSADPGLKLITRKGPSL